MCRSIPQGGRRCPGSGRTAPVNGSGSTAPVPAGDEGQRESYEGTRWQGYDEYQQRAAKLDERIASGESMTDIMREEHMARMQALIERNAREGR